MPCKAGESFWLNIKITPYTVVLHLSQYFLVRYYRKVFKKLGFEVDDDVINKITTCQPWAMEQFLVLLRKQIEQSHPDCSPLPTKSRNSLDDGSPQSTKPKKLHDGGSMPSTKSKKSVNGGSSLMNKPKKSVDDGKTTFYY